MRVIAFVSAFFAVLVTANAQSVDRYVSPGGNDKGPGSLEKPWKTLNRALESIREIDADVRIVVGDGDYFISEPLMINGTRDRKILVEAASGGVPTVRGDRIVSGFKPVKDRTVLSCLAKEVRGKVLEADLKAQGIKDYGNPCSRENLFDLYCNGKRQQLARYPNEGFLKSGEAMGSTRKDDVTFKEGVFGYLDDRVSFWADEKDAWIFGYFRWDWSDYYQKVAGIDKENKVISLAEPWHVYGYKSGFRYYGINLLCELDSPGEYYLDREKGKLYWYPPEDYSKGDVVSVAFYNDDFMLSIEDCSEVELRGLSFTGGRKNAVKVSGSKNIVLEGIGISRFGGDALHVNSSKDVKVERCRFETLGHSGIQAFGGDRKNLEKAGYSIANTVIEDFSLFKHTYEPAVHFVGCGLTVAHCDFSGSTSSAMRIDGSDALVEFNHFHDLVRESDDQGGIDMYYNYGYRGVVIRYNLWEDILGGSLCGAAGVRFDDMISGQVVYGNIFRNVGAVHFGAVQIHGGKDNVVDNNIFYRCHFGVSFSPWSQESWDRALEKEEVKRQLHSDVEIDGPLYTGRYPDLKVDIHKNVNRNIIRNNLAVGCMKMFNDERGVNLLQNNSALFMGESAEKIKSLEYYLDPKVLADFGLKPIPYKEIGPERSVLDF